MKKAFALATTTEGRKHFPDHLQDVYGGETMLVVFHRYGRHLGAMVPLDAVRMLAGEPVDKPTRKKIAKAARDLLLMLENSK